MRAVLILVITLTATFAGYLPNGYRRPKTDRQGLQTMADFFDRLSISAKIKRCGNTFDESCANLPIIGAASDESWLAHGSPGKRCANVWGESCINDGIFGGGSDESW
ncbi:uncharacterized protein LOC123014090 [Tribolium madens]|uniref:uncharacterized protein LOC123014090 n=1 Tax=Tribolium madens TaxID=41895 RepID=UPI001CF74F16|nr:uncharacterized protein LOC123014090 [Tribolium madens]